MKASVAAGLTPRDALADGTMLDLAPFYDMLPPENGVNIRSLAPGTQIWHGVKFDVRGSIQLVWQNQHGLKGIPVGRKCSELYFLHGAAGGRPDEITSLFVIHLTGTNPETVPMVFGRDLAAEYLRNQHGLSVMPTNLMVCQELVSSNAPPQPLLGYFVSHWTNPYPDRTVETIDFNPGNLGDCAFLVAITVKP